MPAYNEAVTVAAAVARVRSVPVNLELIVVDDASSDGTQAILHALHQEGASHTLVTHPENRGKGAAVRTGIHRATGELIVIQDADLEYDPHELPRLMEPILDGRADAVFGSRFTGSPRRVMYFWHRVGNGALTLLSNIVHQREPERHGDVLQHGSGGSNEKPAPANGKIRHRARTDRSPCPVGGTHL
jgi:glycosyltransferase involved in cell wall biosynthesis